MHTISFDTFLVWAFKIVVDSWKFSMFLLYILWDDQPIFMISGLKEQLQQQLEYTLLKPDYHSWWISKMQSGREDTLEERYAIKFCFKLTQRLSLWDNWGDERGCNEGHWHAHTRGLLWGLAEVVWTVQVHCSLRRLLRRGQEFHACTINKSAHTKKNLETYRKAPRILDWIVWNWTVYMYKKGFGINNLKWLMCHKTKLNLTKVWLTAILFESPYHYYY